MCPGGADRRSCPVDNALRPRRRAATIDLVSVSLLPDLSTSPPPPAVPGFVLGELIGRGGSSTVWSARPTGSAESAPDAERVAVKVTAPHGQEAAYVMEVAARERAIQRRVDSEHVVRLRDVVRLEDGAVALVLDLADGGSLQDLVSIRGPIPAGEVVTVLTPIATTLGELHAAGVVHSDVSPGNVLFTAAGKPMLSDYDAARLVGELQPHLVAGTSGFVAPEVQRGELPTEASDVWSLAALAWYALAGGTPPPVGELDTLADIAQDSVGEQFAGVLVPMLDPRPAARPSASSAAVAIYRAAAAAPVRLAGRNPDPGTAMTQRIRRGAATETRSRAELRAVAKSASRTRRRMPRLTARLRPAARVRPAAGQPVARGGGGGSPGLAGWALSQRGRLAVVLLGAVALVVGLLVAVARSGDSTGSAARSPSGGASTRASTAVDPVKQLRSDPQAVLQRLADARADALVRADPAALLTLEIKDSTAHQADVRALAQLRAQQQGYADLGFHVRSAEVVTSDATGAQVRAVIDRTAYTVVGPGTTRQQRPAQDGQALSYSLALTTAGWRITDVAPG